MGKDGDHSDGAKVYESKKEKKRRLVMNNESESEELVITPRVEIFQAGNGAAGGRRSLVLEKGGGGQKGLEREDVLKRKLGSEGSNKGKVLESRSNRSKEIAVAQSDDEDIKLDSADSAGNQTDTTGAIAESLVSLQPSNKLTAGAKEKAFESKFYRKRSIERVDDGDEFSRKRIKTENTDSIDNQSENSRESNKITGGNKGCVQVSNLSAPIAQHRDEDCSSESKLQQSGSGQRELRKVRDARSSDVGIKMEVGDGGSSQHSYGRTQAKSSVLRVLKSRNKVSGSQNANAEFKVQGNAMRLRSSTTNKFSGSNRQLQREADKKSISNAKQQKGAGKVSSEDASKSNVSKANLKNISQKKGSKNHANEQNGSRSAAKNKVRDQIKTILFDAGWKIEFRPRRGRNYEDAVYVSPQGSGYWSITKAYAVYVRQFKRAEDDKENSGNESKSSAPKNNDSKEANSTLAVIPPEVLHMLKRNVVNKRRRKKEIEDAKLKVGGGKKKKKPKEISKAKYSKDKGSRNDVGGAGAIKRKVTVRNSKRRGCALLVRGSNQDEGSEQGDYTPYAWKRTVLSWMIDLGVAPANGKVRYMNKRTSRVSLDGRITRDGIQCGCCGKILTVSKFEIHAGSKLHRPYENICLEASGISLLQCQIDAWAKQEESTRRIFYDVDTHGDDPNDDSCGICGDGGDLICCDSCPSTFHLACLGIEMLPTGDWHCANCSCKFCGAVHDSASQDEKASDALFTCSQCARKYHKDCVPEDDAVSTASNSSCNVFCGRSCRKVFRKLQKIIGVRNELEAGFYWSIVRRLEDPSKPLSRMAQTVENNSKIAVAYAVMDECFVPITDQRSGINLIHNVVYNCGSNFNRLDFSGFYTFILERGDEIVAAASVRIHDTRLAEMPFIGTRCIYRRQGMCRRLLQGIESALRSLCIRNLIIPAISELEDTWTTVFGFKPLGLSQHQELKSVNILVFPGTGLLQKSLLNNSTKKHANNELVAENKSESQIHPDEAMDPIIPVLDHSTSNLVPEESQLRKSSDNVTDSESNNRNLVSCNNHVENCSTEAFLRSEEPEPVTVSLHGAYGIESSEFRPQNQSNSESPVAENEGEKKPEEKSHSNGIAHDPDPKKGEFIDSNGPKSNVNQDAIDVTTNLNASGVCENGSEAAPRTRSAASNESSSPEKSEPLDRLTADDSATDDLLSKLKESTPANSVCDVSVAEKDLGVVEPVHGFDLASINQASKMVK